MRPWWTLALVRPPPARPAQLGALHRSNPTRDPSTWRSPGAWRPPAWTPTAMRTALLSAGVAGLNEARHVPGASRRSPAPKGGGLRSRRGNTAAAERYLWSETGGDRRFCNRFDSKTIGWGPPLAAGNPWGVPFRARARMLGGILPPSRIPPKATGQATSQGYGNGHSTSTATTTSSVARA
ncbi:hypothetical protein ES705_39594 [subsurface metagenome]